MEMFVCLPGRASPPRRSGNEALLKQIRFIDVFDRHRFLVDRSGQRFQADRSPAVLQDDASQQPSVDIVQAKLIDVQSRQSVVRNGFGYDALRRHFREIPHTLQQAVRNTGRTAAALGDLRSAGWLYADAQVSSSI